MSRFVPLFSKSSLKTTQREAVSSTLESIEDLLTKENHFLYRSMEIPAYNKISLSYLGLGIWFADLVESLEMTMSNGFVINMSLPDNQATAKAKTKSSDMNIAEEALGRAPLQKIQVGYQLCYSWLICQD